MSVALAASRVASNWSRLSASECEPGADNAIETVKCGADEVMYLAKVCDYYVPMAEGACTPGE